MTTMTIKCAIFSIALALFSIVLPLSAYAGCTIYQDRNYRGSSWYLESRDRMKMVRGEQLGCSVSHGTSYCGTTYFEPSWNDQVSSFKVKRGCTLTLWQHVNQGGAQFESSKSYKYVGGSWNDVASEAYCYCR